MKLTTESLTTIIITSSRKKRNGRYDLTLNLKMSCVFAIAVQGDEKARPFAETLIVYGSPGGLQKHGISKVGGFFFLFQPSGASRTMKKAYI